MRQEIEEIRIEAKSGLSAERRSALTVKLVKELLISARSVESSSEVKERELLGKILQDPKSKAFAVTFLDQCFRSKNNRRVMRQLHSLLGRYGVPKALSFWERATLLFIKKAGPFCPRLFIPFLTDMVKAASEKVILPSNKEALENHLNKRRKEGVKINLNHLGEAILGEDEALKRLHYNLDDLKNPLIDCISVKITTLYSQIDPIAEEESQHILADRLRILYRAAMEYGFKFVYLDMEEYKHLDLTVKVFLKVLSEEEFFYCSFGIALQSYLPDSFTAQQKITEFAQERVAKGGAPLKIRLVKGANLAMEKVEASLKNFPQAPYVHKVETDGNFLRMLEYGFEHARAVYLGIGSHNLFDIAYAMILREEKGLYKEISFEMLEGMAPTLVKVVQEATNTMLLYCPTASKSSFHNAIAYLMRRLDENAGKENFLHSFFTMDPEGKPFELEKGRFLAGLEKKESVDSSIRRGKPRQQPPGFSNEPDTDWVIRSALDLIHGIYADWEKKQGGHLPIQVGGQLIPHFPKKMFGYDPSLPNEVRYTYTMATPDLADLALQTAKKNLERFKSTEVEERVELLKRAADQFRKKRFDLIGVMMADAGKVPLEADAEVSEAIDFCLYYGQQALELGRYEDVSWEPRGPTLVLPPWNFPCSIPAGCIAAALVAGNTVIFKPAPQTVWVGYEVVKCFWDAGVPLEVLQFITGDDGEVGSPLVQHADTGLVCLTGSNETAKQIYQLNPGIEIIAETGGKNSMIVTALADRDLAISHCIQSAFSHAGQKCSALSLLILENEVYKDPHFFRQLHDAAKSLAVGSAFDPRTKVGPLIAEPTGKLLQGLTKLDEGEEWLIKPRQDGKNPHLWSPGIKLGVKEGSFTHQTELFGPVLGVMRAKNLDHALLLANGTPYGLTSGLHSLDGAEQERWFKKIRAGNCYINRGMTGALVERQPFGGIKESSYGRGHKAGGPNYLTQFLLGKQIDFPKESAELPEKLKPLFSLLSESRDKKVLAKSLENYQYYWVHHFSLKHDPQKILGQDNFFMYAPHRLVLCRMEKGDSLIDLLKVVGACRIAGTPLELSLPKEVYTILSNQAALKGCGVHVENQKDFLDRFLKGFRQRLRLLSKMDPAIKNSVAKTVAAVVDDPVLMNGRFELLHYLREISLSHDYHRYGNLGARENEVRNDESGMSSGHSQLPFE